MEKLNSESKIIENDVILSDLIQFSKENLFILPFAFNSKQVNDTNAKLFDSDVTKLSPTIGFAKKCSNLRLAIINELDRMPLDDRAPFQTMSEWMEMAGVIWDTIIKYQDIVRYRNVDELKCSNKLDEKVTELMQNYIYCNLDRLKTLTSGLCEEINSVQSEFDRDTKLSEIMNRFDILFATFQNSCIDQFVSFCQSEIHFSKKCNIFVMKKMRIPKC